MQYRRTQWGYFVPFALPLLIALVAVTYAVGDESTGLLLVVSAILLVVLILGMWLSVLTVVVAEGFVSASFAFGKPKKEFDLTEVVAVRTVRNPWYYGWGIRKIPHGWMYNVWGLDAVELELPDNRLFRIGSDQVESLHAAIALQMSSSSA